MTRRPARVLLVSQGNLLPAAVQATSMPDTKPIFRLPRILFELIRFAAGSITAEAPWSRSRLRPQRLRLSLERLGTTFIKFGQALSLRREMLPDAHVAARPRRAVPGRGSDAGD